MAIHVSGDLYQIGESVGGADGWCEAVRVYVLLNDGQPLIFDAGSHLHTAPIMADLKELLGGTKPAFVFLTHTELPHTGNMSAIAKGMARYRVCRIERHSSACRTALVGEA